jgi:hypothetical protein
MPPSLGGKDDLLGLDGTSIKPMSGYRRNGFFIPLVLGGIALWNFAIGTCRSLRRLKCGAIESMQGNTTAR